MTKQSENFMNGLSEAISISKRKFNDPTSENFSMNLKFPNVFTFFKFQNVKLFTFFHTCSIIFQLFTATKAQWTKEAQWTTKKIEVVNKYFEEIIHFKWVRCLNCFFCNTDID